VEEINKTFKWGKCKTFKLSKPNKIFFEGDIDGLEIRVSDMFDGYAAYLDHRSTLRLRHFHSTDNDGEYQNEKDGFHYHLDTRHEDPRCRISGCSGFAFRVEDNFNYTTYVLDRDKFSSDCYSVHIEYRMGKFLPLYIYCEYELGGDFLTSLLGESLSFVIFLAKSWNEKLSALTHFSIFGRGDTN